MNEQKNKQHPPQQGNKPGNDKNQQGQKSKRPDQVDQAEKKPQIDDNPEETKKKVPNMQNKH